MFNKYFRIGFFKSSFFKISFLIFVFSFFININISKADTITFTQTLYSGGYSSPGYPTQTTYIVHNPSFSLSHHTIALTPNGNGAYAATVEVNSSSILPGTQRTVTNTCSFTCQYRNGSYYFTSNTCTNSPTCSSAFSQIPPYSNYTTATKEITYSTTENVDPTKCENITYRIYSTTYKSNSSYTTNLDSTNNFISCPTATTTLPTPPNTAPNLYVR